MRTGFLAILVLALLAISSATSIAASSKGGGGSCAGKSIFFQNISDNIRHQLHFFLLAACVLIVDLVEKIAVQEAGGSVSKAFDYLCGNFQGSLSWLAGICDSLTGILAIPIQLALEVGEIPDNTCKTGGLAFLKMCTADDAQCQLFHSPVHSRLSHYSAVAPDAKDARIAAHLRMFGALLGERVSTPVVNHRPLVDDDQDAFSTAPTLRGYHWRGRDCNDQDGSVYPGRAVNAEGSSVDHNCNGISGTDPQTQQAYEDELCSGPNQPRGTIIIGDSAAAHFSLPPKYLMPDNQNSSSVYLDLLPLLEDEADYPHCSWSTGFANESTGSYLTQCESLEC
jgi:acyloxyacyl hydrolase